MPLVSNQYACYVRHHFHAIDQNPWRSLVVAAQTPFQFQGTVSSSTQHLNNFLLERPTNNCWWQSWVGIHSFFQVRKGPVLKLYPKVIGERLEEGSYHVLHVTVRFEAANTAHSASFFSDSAWYYRIIIAQVGRYIEGEAMHSDPAARCHPDSANFVFSYPHTRVDLIAGTFDAQWRQSIYHGLLKGICVPSDMQSHEKDPWREMEWNRWEGVTISDLVVVYSRHNLPVQVLLVIVKVQDGVANQLTWHHRSKRAILRTDRRAILVA